MCLEGKISALGSWESAAAISKRWKGPVVGRTKNGDMKKDKIYQNFRVRTENDGN